MSQTNIYVLACKGGRYYIGKSDNVQKRFQQHVDGGGSAWTRKYKALSIQEIRPNVSHFEEDKAVKEYMDKYGIDKVRGGSYSEIELSESQVEALKRENRGAKDLCTRCGRGGHFVKDCYARKEASENTIEVARGKSKKEQVFEKQMEAYQRHRHFASENTIEGDDDEDDDEDDDDDELVWECEYCDREFTTEYGCSVHERSCRKGDTRSYAAPVRGSGACFRCGRQGHYSPDCYARSHVNGHEID